LGRVCRKREFQLAGQLIRADEPGQDVEKLAVRSEYQDLDVVLAVAAEARAWRVLWSVGERLAR
jgi:hypothetical protein